MSLEKLADRIGDAFAAAEESARRERPRKVALEEHKRSTPRLVYRNPRWGRSDPPEFSTIRLAQVTIGKRYDGKRGEEVHIQTSGANRAVLPERVGDYVRIPTAHGLERIEAAEAALRVAELELKAARQVAFANGKAPALAAVRRTNEARLAIWRRYEEEPVEDAIHITRS